MCGDAYRRSFELAGAHGVVEVRPVAGRDHLLARIRLTDPAPLIRIAERLRNLFDLGADPGAIEAVRRLKPGRDRPFILLVPSAEAAAGLAWTPAARELAAVFWPGALTLVLLRSQAFETRAAAGKDTIGVRVPGDAAIREIALHVGPLTATSANRSGGPECRSAAEVREQLGDSVDFIVDAAIRPDARASTVVDCTDANALRILRSGDITADQIAQALDGAGALARDGR